MVSKKDSNQARLRRHTRVRGKITGTVQRPRLNVYRSLNHIYAQIIDDVKGVPLWPLRVSKRISAWPAGTRKPLRRLAS